MGIANACINIYLGELSVVRLRGFAGGLNPMVLMVACSITLTLNTVMPLDVLLKVRDTVPNDMQAVVICQLGQVRRFWSPTETNTVFGIQDSVQTKFRSLTNVFNRQT